MADQQREITVEMKVTTSDSTWTLAQIAEGLAEFIEHYGKVETLDVTEVHPYRERSVW